MADFQNVTPIIPLAVVADSAALKAIPSAGLDYQSTAIVETPWRVYMIWIPSDTSQESPENGVFIPNDLSPLDPGRWVFSFVLNYP
jgi:hypothetical protein